jgi:hypothetical protein
MALKTNKKIVVVVIIIIEGGLNTSFYSSIRPLCFKFPIFQNVKLKHQNKIVIFDLCHSIMYIYKKIMVFEHYFVGDIKGLQKKKY